MFKMDSIRGGSPYGAGVFAGDGTRKPSETELALAEHQGKYMAAFVKKLFQPQGFQLYRPFKPSSDFSPSFYKLKKLPLGDWFGIFIAEIDNE